MEKTVIKIVGINFEIFCRHKNLSYLCKDYLSNENPDYTITITDEDIQFEKDKCEPGEHYSDGYLETISAYRKICDILPGLGSFLVHGASIANEHRAFLFTAKSGVGKSTHIKLWLDNIDGTYILNGDKPIITAKDNIMISGTPWCGKESLNANITEPLKAIIFVNRSNENSIKKITSGEAFMRFYHQINKPKDAISMKNTIKLIEKVVNEVPFYDLYCNMDKEAAEIAAKELLSL